MNHFEPLLQFSHQHCVAICAALVPLNLLATSLTLGLVIFAYPENWRRWSMAIASLFASVMVLHVLTWFVVGVVMLPTYVLLLLASVCLLINFWACFHPASLRFLLKAAGQRLGQLLHRTGFWRGAISVNQ